MKAGKKAGLAALLFFSLSFQALGQVLPSVDVDTARTQINQFLSENDLIGRQIAELESTNGELSADIETWNTWLSGIQDVTGRIVERANQLMDIVSELASKSVVGRAQTALERYYRIKAVLDDKHEELTGRIAAAEASIERNDAVVLELKEKIQSNLDNVELLKAAIERSAGSEETINAYIESLEKALDDAQKIINQSYQ